jgi:ABC-type phosphate/phosphonate transport system substrate-binding protein
MLVLASNNEINSIADIKDKVVGAQDFSDFAGAQAQFYVMYKNGVDFVLDPKQVIFTGMSFLRIHHNGLYLLS